jgi:hypothetical protein
MCVPFAKKPYEVILEEKQSSAGIFVKTYTFGLGKMSDFRNGEHYSSQGFLYPLRKPVYDSKAKVGDHNYGLHLTPDVETASQLTGFGGHPMVVLPGPELWDDPEKSASNRCWHAASVIPLFCATCEGLSVAELTNPAFWAEITKPRRMRRAAGASSGFDALRIPRSDVWHKQVALSTN